uniref:Uncharacterized protein n=1 Tax=Anguilla anguilla TaxID=7936 RepID=A0A0E9TCA3_ANGAN
MTQFLHFNRLLAFCVRCSRTQNLFPSAFSNHTLLWTVYRPP